MPVQRGARNDANRGVGADETQRRTTKKILMNAMRERNGFTNWRKTAGVTAVPWPRGKGRKAAGMDNKRQCNERWEGSKGNECTSRYI